VGCGSRRVGGCNAADGPAGPEVGEIVFGHGARSVLAVDGLEGGGSQRAVQGEAMWFWSRCEEVARNQEVRTKRTASWSFRRATRT